MYRSEPSTGNDYRLVLGSVKPSLVRQRRTLNRLLARSECWVAIVIPEEGGLVHQSLAISQVGLLLRSSLLPKALARKVDRHGPIRESSVGQNVSVCARRLALGETPRSADRVRTRVAT